MKSTNYNHGRLAWAAGLASLAIALTACGTAAPAADGSSGKVDVQGAMPEPTDAKTVKEYTSFDGVAAYEPAASLLPEDIRKKGVLVFGTDPTASPTKFVGSDGKTFVGLDADIARALGKVLDVQVAFKSTTFDALIPGLQAKRFDAAIADMGVTKERLEVIDMVGYVLGGHAIATNAGNPLGIGEKSMCGHKVGVAAGSIQAVKRGPAYSSECVTAGNPAIELITLPNQQELLLQVSSGQIDAGYMDAPAIAWAAKQNPDKIELAATIPGSILSMGILNGSPLTAALVPAMKHLATLPEYDEIGEKWGMNYATIDPKYLDSYETPPTPPTTQG